MCVTIGTMKVEVGHFYQHYKAARMKYEVIAIAVNSETLEEMVVYRCLYNNPLGEIWVRPREMFESKVKVNGKWVERFREI